jgi:crossover junction endodeoxyribonuclease RuvC
MRILGIDPALRITGYGVIALRSKDKQNHSSNKKNFFLLEAGIITTSAKELLPQRLDKIYQATAKLVSDTRPDVVVLEKLYVHYRHPTTAYILGQARGIICLVVAKKKLPLVEYSATRVKKAIVGQGLAPKYQVQQMVAHLLGLKSLPKYTDVTDALALAIAHSYIAKFKI